MKMYFPSHTLYKKRPKIIYKINTIAKLINTANVDDKLFNKSKFF